MSRRFATLPDHPGETEAFRSRFRNAVGLLFAYRALGTLAATLAFLGSDAHQTPGGDAIIGLSVAYVAWALVLAHQTSTVRLRLGSWRATLGAGRGEPLDSPIALGIDVALAVIVNLTSAVLLPEGTAFQQFTDVFAVASITTAALWTGRRGGKVGAVVTAGVLVAELIKAPLNGLTLSDVDATVVATRWAWIACGWLVALGTVRILLDFADWVQALRVEDEVLDAVSRAHDDHRSALVAISGMVGEPSEMLDQARERARLALAVSEAPKYPDGTVASVVAHAISMGRAAAPTDIRFLAVDGAKVPIHLSQPDRVDQALVNLCVNAGRHSKGTLVTVRWAIDDGRLKLTVHDDGVGMPDGAEGAGLAIVNRNIAHIGGRAEVDEVRSNGTKWRIQLPATAFTTAGQPS